MSLPDPAGLALPELGGRLRLVGQLPTAVGTLVVVAVVLSGAPGPPSWSRLVRSVTDLSAEEVGWLAAAVAVLTVLLHPLQRGLVRLLEGYPLLRGPAAPLGRALLARWQKRFDKLSGEQQRPVDPLGAPTPTPEQTAARRKADAAMVRAAAELRHLPGRDRLMPTRLGNVLRSAEDEARIRYGIETVVVWPMLYPLVSDRLAAGLQDARDRLDLSARFAGTFVVTAVISAALLIRSIWAVPVLAGLLALAALSHRAAVAAAGTYGELINAAITLHRFDLLTALHLTLPKTAGEERATYRRLQLLLRNRLADPTAAFDHPD